MPFAFLVASLAAFGDLHAVCLDPKTWGSGYHVPIDQEIESSDAIIIARVVDARRIFDNPSDPESFSATIYTVRIERLLKGDPPAVVKIHDGNDSGRYGMNKGEQHILFLTRRQSESGAEYFVDSCGSSARLPAGSRIVRQVLARRQEIKN